MPTSVPPLAVKGSHGKGGLASGGGKGAAPKGVGGGTWTVGEPRLPSLKGRWRRIHGGSCGGIDSKAAGDTPGREDLLKVDVERERRELERAARADEAAARLLPENEVRKAALGLDDAFGPAGRTRCKDDVRGRSKVAGGGDGVQRGRVSARGGGGGEHVVDAEKLESFCGEGGLGEGKRVVSSVLGGVAGGAGGGFGWRIGVAVSGGGFGWQFRVAVSGGGFGWRIGEGAGGGDQ